MILALERAILTVYVGNFSNAVASRVQPSSCQTRKTLNSNQTMDLNLQSSRKKSEINKSVWHGSPDDKGVLAANWLMSPAGK